MVTMTATNQQQYYAGYPAEAASQAVAYGNHHHDHQTAAYAAAVNQHHRNHHQHQHHQHQFHHHHHQQQHHHHQSHLQQQQALQPVYHSSATGQTIGATVLPPAVLDAHQTRAANMLAAGNHSNTNSPVATATSLYTIETTKSTKGASKLRRDLINTEIAQLRELLPLPASTRQRLSQLQLMALVLVYVRKSNYFCNGKFQSIGLVGHLEGGRAIF